MEGQLFYGSRNVLEVNETKVEGVCVFIPIFPLISTMERKVNNLWYLHDLIRKSVECLLIKKKQYHCVCRFHEGMYRLSTGTRVMYVEIIYQ